MERLYEQMRRQLAYAPQDFRRYMYDRINWDNRMFGLVGPRGAGKTTLFLQRIKNAHDLSDTLYCSADDLYFTSHTLFDTAESFSKEGGMYLFIDEVHKYPGWSRELKLMYDAFPQLHVYFNGSSILDIEKGEADLSRRAPRYLMQGLSFREYLAIRHGIELPVFTLEDVLAHRAETPLLMQPLPYFHDYLQSGYYPFGADVDFPTELEQVISRTLEVDIPLFAGMTAATGRKLKKLLSVVSTLVPFKPNMSSLAKQLQVSRNVIEEYLLYLEKAGMIAQLRSGAGGLGALGKAEKVYLDNPNILYCLGGSGSDSGTVRETFFLNQTRVGHDVVASPVSDFRIGDFTFEVGGKNKGQSQVADVEGAYIVKDDIEYGYGNVIPLWTFGMMY